MRKEANVAKDNSFDVVSECDLQEVDNAYQQTLKALSQRYDLKGSGSTIDYDKANKTFTVIAPSEFVKNQVTDVLNTHLIRRLGEDGMKFVKWGNNIDASGGNIRCVGTIAMGLDQDTAKKINKEIKDQKFKVKTQIEGDKLRVSAPKRDELQNVIAFLRGNDYGVPLQFTNYR